MFCVASFADTVRSSGLLSFMTVSLWPDDPTPADPLDRSDDTCMAEPPLTDFQLRSKNFQAVGTAGTPLCLRVTRD